MPNLKHDLNLMLEAITDNTKIIFLPSPNNPTGTSNTTSEINSFVEQLPDHVILCLDEAYAEYLEEPTDIRPFLETSKKVIGLRTFSKIHGLAGLRIGYGYGTKEMISLLQKSRQPFNANSVAQASAIGALEDEEIGFCNVGDAIKMAYGRWKRVSKILACALCQAKQTSSSWM